MRVTLGTNTNVLGIDRMLVVRFGRWDREVTEKYVYDRCYWWGHIPTIFCWRMLRRHIWKEDQCQTRN
jgi:hypothetical protein